jgi:tetratricopeptide (TPR) repeat protein
MDRSGWIDILVRGLQPPEEKEKKRVLEPIYYALRDEGTQAAVRMYFDFKNNRSDEYSADETDLVFIAYKLNLNGRVDEALAFFELCAEEYPEGYYAYYCHHSIGEIYRNRGDKDLALRHYRKSLEANPDNTSAAEAIAELEAE